MERNNDATLNGSYIGVRQRTPGKWTSEIWDPSKRGQIWLGSFDTPEMAAVAHDIAAYFFRGRRARLNFPHLVNHGRLPSPRSPSLEHICEAAHEAIQALQSMPASSTGVAPVTISLSPQEIEALRQYPMYSPEVQMSELGQDQECRQYY